MKKEQIAVQIFSFREYIKTEEDVVKTFRKLKKMGYDNIELSPSITLPEKDLCRILKDEGLNAPRAGINSIKFMEDPAPVLARLNGLGCKNALIGGPHMIPTDERELERFIDDLKSITLAFKEAGIKLSYHNHAFEFMHFGKRTWLDAIYKEIPELAFEPDIFWIHAGGGNPLTWLRRMAGRMDAIHIKDYGVVDNTKWLMMPLGDGNLEWNEIIPTAEKAGVKYFVVEHDADCPDPFKSFQTSINYLNENFLK